MGSITGQLGNIRVGDDIPAVIMGVINLDPNSFYQNSYYRNQRRVLEAVEKMVTDEVDLIDIGGASSAPGSPSVSVEVESKRVVPVIKAITKQWDVPISVDTQRAQVAQAAITHGASIVNDVSGLKTDSMMAAIISRTGASCVLMASSIPPGDSCTPDQIIKALKDSLQLANKAAISKEKIVIDPGIGFGKPTNCDLRIIRTLHEFRVLNHPILVSISRKSFIGKVLGYPAPADRLAGTLAAVTFALLEGVHILRAHDVRETRDCIKIVNAIQLAIESD